MKKRATMMRRSKIVEVTMEGPLRDRVKALAPASIRVTVGRVSVLSASKTEEDVSGDE